MMADVVDLQAWKARIQSGRNGPKKSVTNLLLHLQNIKELGNTIRWNELAQQAEWNSHPIEDSHLIDIRLILEHNDFEPPLEALLPTIVRHAKDNAFHPVRDYLRALKWDGTRRLDYWLEQCLGSPKSQFNRLVGRKTLIAAVARAFRPGCKVDTVLVLEGPQGIRKSSAIAALFGEDWTAESVDLFGQHNKMVMNMMGAWVVELAEFIAITKRDQNHVKGLLSMRTDKVVLPYAKIASAHPRQCVFFGTINPGETGYLTDTTGNRRYWPVEVVRADLEKIKARRDQLWAEAYKAFCDDERWWLEEDEQGLAEAEVATREEYDVWDEILGKKLDDEMVKTVTAAAALQAIGVPNERMDKRALNRVGACLRRLGYEPKPRKMDVEGEKKTVKLFIKSER
ncbi:MAG: putative primase [Prokaryotic dsDNA virus sp.]|nr:MAG: putative primase [Prokaryotic dsDNA virus sp.]